jgi:hypothetical protein
MLPYASWGNYDCVFFALFHDRGSISLNYLFQELNPCIM